MPYILFYADKKDLKSIEEYFNGHAEVAFIVPDGQRRWRAVETVSGLRRKSVALWHVPSGPLPLLQPNPSDRDGRISNPWKGWKELRAGADRSSPYFGPGHPGVIWLSSNPRGIYKPGNMGMSSLEWIGNHYSACGSRAK